MHIVGLQGVLYYELLKPEEKVTEKLNKEQLQMFNQKIQELMPHHAHTGRKVLLLHDNARPHVALANKDTILELCCELLPHPAYSKLSFIRLLLIPIFATFFVRPDFLRMRKRFRNVSISTFHLRKNPFSVKYPLAA